MKSSFVETTPALCAIIHCLPRSAFPAVDATPPEANGPNSARLVVKLECYLLSLLRIHGSDCAHCKAREIYGDEMRKRLEELNWRTQPNLLKKKVNEDL